MFPNKLSSLLFAYVIFKFIMEKQCFKVRSVFIFIFMNDQAFLEGLMKLQKLYRINNASFLKFYSTVLDLKFSVLMEFGPHQDLLTYICEHPQTVKQKVGVMDQIIKILVVMVCNIISLKSLCKCIFLNIFSENSFSTCMRKLKLLFLLLLKINIMAFWANP